MTVRRIAIVFEYNTLNGGERSMLAAIDSLRMHRMDFEIVAIGPREGRLAEALMRRGVPLVEWSVRDKTGHRNSSEQIQAELLQVIAGLNPDLVHANSLAMGRTLGQAASRLKIPTTSHLRDIIKLSKAAIDDMNLNRRLIAVSHATRDFHVQQGLHNHLVTVVHNGIRCESDSHGLPTGWLAKELLSSPHSERTATDVSCQETPPPLECVCPSPVPLGPQVRFVACIGQIGLRKGLDTLAAAALTIVQQIPNVHFLLIGERTSQKAESIEFERSVRQRFDDDGISSHIHWLGHRDDVARILQEVDLLVHPANQEPFGRVLLEASAAGLPIVATDVGGTSEIVVHGQTGILVSPRDPRALAEAVVSLLLNPQTARRMGEAGKQRTTLEFSIATAAAKLANVWNGVLNETPIHPNA